MTDAAALVVGVDLGVSGARAAAMDTAGRIVGRSERFPVATRATYGRAEQDPEAWLDAVSGAIRSLAGSIDTGRVAGVGVSALGPAPVLVDRDLRPLTPALLFSLDTRAERQRRELAQELGMPDATLTHDHAIPKLLWLREHEPAAWARAAFALDAAGFLVATLTGAPTMDAITACDYALAHIPAPLPTPEPRDPCSVAGVLTATWSANTGLAAGVPVFAGTYDSHADTAATGTLLPGDAAIVFGTTLAIGLVCAERPATLDGLVASPHLGPGCLVGGATSTGGSALEWVLRVIDVPPRGPTALEQAAVDSAPGSGGLLFLPYLHGERSPINDPRARGVLLGVSADTRPPDVYRAVIDGLAFSVCDHAERLARIAPAPSSWRAGGGGTANRAWVQATSDALGAPIEVVADAGAPIGPCRLALRGLGADPPVAVAAVIEPRAEHRARLDALYRMYRSLYAGLAQDMHLLTELNQHNGG